MAGQNILLDGAILPWVLCPLVVIMIFVGLLRHYAAILTINKPAFDLQAAKERSASNYARLVLSHGGFVPPDGFKARVRDLVGTPGLLLRQKVVSNPMQAMMDPSVSSNMMKQMMLGMLPNVVMSSVINFFFGGFVIAKFPFPLAARFKGMVQRGVEIDHLDASYATSMSLYFLALFGLQGILSVVLGDVQGDDMAVMNAQMQAAGQQQPNQDMNAVFKQQAEEVEFSQDHYGYLLQGSGARLLQSLPPVPSKA